MANSNAARCESARDNLKKLQDERDAKRNQIGRLEERVRVTKGEISVAENELSRIHEAIQNTREGAVGVLVGTALTLGTGSPSYAGSSVTAFAIQLANEAARQKSQLAALKHRLQNEERELQYERRELAAIEGQITMAHSFIRTHDCP